MKEIVPNDEFIDVLLDDNGIIKYVDFGAAKVIAKQGKTKIEATKPGLNSMTGTPMYMSPEGMYPVSPSPSIAISISYLC